MMTDISHEDKIVRLEEALKTASYDALLSAIKAHALSKCCRNYEVLARWIAKEFNYGPNSITYECMAHFDNEHRHPSGKTLQCILEGIASDPEQVHLLSPKPITYKRPAHNPWLREHFHLGRQGDVFKHEPDLARSWAEVGSVINKQGI